MYRHMRSVVRGVACGHKSCSISSELRVCLLFFSSAARVNKLSVAAALCAVSLHNTACLCSVKSVKKASRAWWHHVSVQSSTVGRRTRAHMAVSAAQMHALRASTQRCANCVVQV